MKLEITSLDKDKNPKLTEKDQEEHLAWIKENESMLNPNYAIEITNLAFIIAPRAFARKSLINLWVNLKFFTNTLGTSINAIFSNPIA